jgi:hypothetical protein
MSDFLIGGAGLAVGIAGVALAWKADWHLERGEVVQKDIFIISEKMFLQQGDILDNAG